MLKKIRKSFRNRIFVIMFSYTCVILAVLSMVVGLAFSAVVNTDIERQLYSSARIINKRINTLISDASEVIDTLEEEKDVREFWGRGEGNDLPLLRQLYLVKASLGRGIEISVINNNTGVWITTNDEHRSANLILDGLADWGIFRKAMERDEIVTATTAKDNFISANDRIYIAKAFKQDQVVQGFILIEVTRNALANLMNENRDSVSRVQLVGNNQGSILYSSNGISEEGLGKLRNIEKQEGDELQEISDDEISYLNDFIYTHNSNADIYLLLAKPTSAVISIVMWLIIILIVTGCVFITLSFFLANYLARNLAEPILALHEGMEKMENGHLNTRLNIQREDELGELGKSFNSMADKIRSLMENIDEKQHSLWIAETRSLNLQMNPHFLYNTLDAIKWEAKLGNTEGVSRITVLLGRILRKIMSTNEELVSVSYELDLIQSFVEIMKLHYENLMLNVNIPEEFSYLIIPKLILQPIVENAIVHGFPSMDGSCEINITGYFDVTEKQYLVFIISDNGIGMTQEEIDNAFLFRQENSHHIGLSNVQQRARLYGDSSCGMSIKSKQGKGTVVMLRILAVSSTKDGTICEGMI